MADEVTVPLLPCGSIDDIVAFYRALGFRQTYYQRKPNPYVSVQRDDLALHFFELPGFEPEQSYGSCLVLTPDLEGLHRAFADGMRAAYGRVLVSGTPRMTRPRVRANSNGIGGFSLIDPGGNWIRITRKAASETAGPETAGPETAGPEAAGPRTASVGRLAKALADAVVQADSRGNAAQGARILDTALGRLREGDDPVTVLEVLVYRAELAMVLTDRATAAEMLARAERVVLDADEEERATATRENAADVATALRAASRDSDGS